jgi:hypothetical protein
VNSRHVEDERIRRDVLAWELALVAATTAEFTQHAEDLGVPSAKALADAGRQYLAMDEWPKATPLRVRRARRWVDQASGARVLAALDSWVRDDFIYFADPAVHYLHAVERAQLDRETTPVTSVGRRTLVAEMVGTGSV